MQAAVLSLLCAGAAGAGTPPAVFHSPSDDGWPHLAQFQIGAPGLHTLHCYLETGSAESLVTEEVCLDGSGDELCGVQLDVETTGGIGIVSFTPDPAVAAELVWNLVDPTLLRINRVTPSGGGDFGTLRLGDLVVENLGPGSVTLRSSSVAVLANLTKAAPTGAPIAVPEPGQWTLLLPALAFLALEHRRRRARTSESSLS
jgi:hypothetical protein